MTEIELAHADALPVPTTPAPDANNPYYTYLDSLRSAEARRTMQGCLDRLAVIMVPDLAERERPGALIPWHLATYKHAAKLNAVIAEKLELGKKGAKGGWSPSHANKHIIAWRRVVYEAWRHNLMTAEQRDRAREIKTINAKREPRGRSIGNDEITAMLGACVADDSPIGTRDAAVIALLWTTGGRRAEAAGAQIERYNGAERSLILTGKGDDEREVYVHALARPYIDAWVTRVGARSGPLLRPVDQWGNIPARHLSTRAVGEIVNKRRAALGLRPLSTHDYRRTFISNMLAAGVDIVTVQELVGHASPVTTARYDRRPKLRRRAAVDMLNLDPEKKATEGAGL